MAVEGVNNNNAAVYAGTGAALAGGAIGGTTGYFTKSFLKDGEPTDEFVKKVTKNMKKELEEFFPDLKAQGDMFKNAKTADECKKIMIDSQKAVLKDIDLDEAKKAIKGNADILESAGLKGIDAKDINKASNLDELLDVYAKNFDENFAGKSVKEINAVYDNIANKKVKPIIKQVLATIYDSDKKKFIDIGKLELGDTPIEKFLKKTAKAFTDAASSIKWKAAGIYGGIAAALLGLGTYFGVANGMKAQAPEAAEAAEEQIAETQQADA